MSKSKSGYMFLLYITVDACVVNSRNIVVHNSLVVIVMILELLEFLLIYDLSMGLFLK